MGENPTVHEKNTVSPGFCGDFSISPYRAHNFHTQLGACADSILEPSEPSKGGKQARLLSVGQCKVPNTCGDDIPFWGA